MEGRSKPLPYVATALEVSSWVLSRQSAAICPLVEVVQSQLTLSKACGTLSATRQDYLLIITCADATRVWQTCAKTYTVVTTLH